MKTLRFFGTVLMTVLLSVSFSACSSDDDDDATTNNVTATLQQNSFTTYQPSGTISIPVKISDNNAQMTISDVELSFKSFSSTSTNLAIPTNQLTSLTGVKRGDEAGTWNIEVNVNLNNIEKANIVLGIKCFGKEVGDVTFQCNHAHKLSMQTIEPGGTCYFDVDSLLTAENATLDLDRMMVGEINKQDGSFTLSYLFEGDCTIGTSGDGTTQRSFEIEDFGYMANGHSYSFIVRLQRSEKESDGYVWFELPVICKEAQ